MKNLCICRDQEYAQWRFWSDCASAQSDLTPRCAYVSEGTFLPLRILLYKHLIHILWTCISTFFLNTETPIICYKCNKPICNIRVIFNFNKLVSGFDIEIDTPDSWECVDSQVCCTSAGRIITGNSGVNPNPLPRHSNFSSVRVYAVVFFFFFFFFLLFFFHIWYLFCHCLFLVSS